MISLNIEKKEFLKGLSVVQGITGKKTTLPILSHMLMEWKDNKLYLTGTDLETAIREELNAETINEGKASVSAKKLYEIVRELPEEEVKIERKENNWISIKCGRSVFNLAGLDPEEFPSLPKFNDKLFSKIQTKNFREMIEKTVYAASNEESRYNLNGVFFTFKKIDQKEIPDEKEKSWVRMVATDGHRLSLIELVSKAINGIEKGVIIPKKSLLEMKKLISDQEGYSTRGGSVSGGEEIDVYFDQTHGFFKLGKTLMIIRTIDGEYPEYEQVIPKDNDKKLRVLKDKMYGCLKRISTMANERVEGIKISLKTNEMEISSFHQDFGDAMEEMDIEYTGIPIDIGFNARYLLEAINTIDSEEFIIELKDSGSAVLIKPEPEKENFYQISIVMPMRV